MAAEYFIGLDLGQARDHTALAVVERAGLRGALRLRHLERLRLGTAYPEVVERVAEVVRSPELRGRKHLVVDTTGVGRPVVDLLRRARLGCRLWGTVMTRGARETRVGAYYGTPKRAVIVGLQVLLESGRLKIAEGMPEVEALVREMLAMEVRVTRAGNEKFGAWRGHDDLVVATGLACWAAGRGGDCRDSADGVPG